MDEDAAILDYIRANRDQYTKDAMRKALLEAGHSPEAIDRVGRLSDEEVRQDSLDLRWPTAGIVLAAYVLAFLLFSLFSNFRQSSSGGFLLALLGAFLIGGFSVSLVAIYLSRSLRDARRSRMMGAVAVGLIVPAVLLLAITGLCVLTTGSFNQSYS